MDVLAEFEHALHPAVDAEDDFRPARSELPPPARSACLDQYRLPLGYSGDIERPLAGEEVALVCEGVDPLRVRQNAIGLVQHQRIGLPAVPQLEDRRASCRERV